MAGACRLGDRAKAPIDSHNCAACPHHNVIGPAISASSSVYINGMPALRQGDIGMHSTCCGTNMWKVLSASGQVFINGSAMVRKGDPTQHCGGMGEMMEASANVSDNSPLTHGGPFGGIPQLPPLPPNQVLVFPEMEPFGSHDLPPGLPTAGAPQLYDEQAAIRQKYANLPHASEGPSDEEKAAGFRHAAFNDWLAGNDDAAAQATGRADQLDGHAKYEAAKKGLEAIMKAAGADVKARKEAKESLDKLERDYRASQRSETELREPREARIEEVIP
ncbi:MAG TPA: PAAR domain-containing protein [Kofleriaceae bacterium]|nr:PAAR domain-containing protein [Kofleriaceae bacterium]